MARFFIQVMTIIILASVFELLLPWWSIAVAAMIGGFVFRSSANFWAGFLAIGLLWAITSLIIDLSAGANLTGRVAAVFMIPKPALFVVTSLIGALVGGFAAMAGAALRKPRKNMKYY